jgi:chitin disaccharide deacetylase
MNRRTFLHNGAIGLAGLLAVSSKAGSNAAGIRLITRGDDLGCARSLNRAVKECYEKGILKNCSVLAATPYVEEAAKLLAGEKGLCFGLHCDLTSEWDNVRWKPVAPPDKVPSLIGKDGTLHQTNEAVWASAKADEALVELQAQLDRARRLGFDIKYADLHMGTVQRVPGLAEQFDPWCRSQRIIDTRGIGAPLPFLPNFWNSPGRKKQGDYVEQLITALKSALDGEYLIVGHTAYDDEETRKLGHDGYPGDSVAHNLNWERLGYADPRIVKFVKENGVQPIRYDETQAAREQAKEFPQSK